MADVLTPEQRSRCMAAIRSKNTTPELTVRRLSHAMGYRFRLHCRDLPGKPDLVFPKLRCVVLVHGCFWHQHHCSDGRIPASRRSYWSAKLQGNQQRDARTRAALRKLGWRILTVWECETTDAERLAIRLSRFFNSCSRQIGRPRGWVGSC